MSKQLIKDEIWTISSDIDKLTQIYKEIPRYWDGRKCILELKDADYQWRQMEWIGWYFEYISRKMLNSCFDIPGDKVGNVTFDLKRSINWDFKTHAIKSHTHKNILNDVKAMQWSIDNYKAHGEIICLCDVDYNDDNRSFQKWHTELKGGLSSYEQDRISRNATSRYRKTKAVVKEIVFLVIRQQDLEYLAIHKQGRNSNGHPREPKYMIDLEDIGNIEQHKMIFGEN